MPWPDLCALLTRARDQGIQSGRDSENLAMLLDRWDYALGVEHADRVTDPDDPHLAAMRARRKLLGIEPPPSPILPPIALRPPEMEQARMDYYREQSEKYRTPDPDRPLTVGEYLRLANIPTVDEVPED